MEKEMANGMNITEIEILEFKAGGNSYGISVNDIKEILSFDGKSTPVPNSHPFIEGIIMPRDLLIPVIDLKKCLGLTQKEDEENDMIIVTGINNLNIAVHVDSVCGIHRKQINEIKKPGKMLTTSQKNVIVGILKMEDKIVEIVDLRKVINNINPEIDLSQEETLLNFA